MDVSTEELLSAERAFTYADLYAMLGNGETIAWLTPHAAVALVDRRVARVWGQQEESCRLLFNADGNKIVAMARSPEHLLEFAMFFFDYWHQASFIQYVCTIGVIMWH
jgi:hypothetical protein